MTHLTSLSRGGRQGTPTGQWPDDQHQIVAAPKWVNHRGTAVIGPPGPRGQLGRAFVARGHTMRSAAID